MLLLITCRYLEIADRRMTTAIKLIFAQPRVAGAPPLMRQLMGDGMLHRRAFPQRGSSTLGLELGAQLLLKQFVLADAQASAVPTRGGRALGAQGTRITRRRRKLCQLAWNHGDGLAPRTGHLHFPEVQGEIMLREQRTTLRPGTRDLAARDAR